MRASYLHGEKKATLIHELIHILLVDNNLKISGGSLEIHKKIFFILYEVWFKLYGKNFVNEMIAIESERSDIYKEAWKYVLNNK